MIRYSVLTLAVLFLVGLAWRDWYKSLCGLIVFMALLERPDMPTNMFNIPGLNPWNVIMLSVLLSWLTAHESGASDVSLPRAYRRLGTMYFIVVLVSVSRMLMDSSSLIEFSIMVGDVPPTWAGLFLDHVLNSLKWVLPAFLLYVGCNSRERWNYAIAAISVACVLFAIQVINFMPIGRLIDGTEMQQRANRVLGRNIGYHRVDLAALLASATWALYLLRDLSKNNQFRLSMLVLSAVSFLALLLTGGRAGLAACMIVGVAFGVLRWRKLLVLAPIVVVIAMVVLPAVKERVLEGFTEESHETSAVARGANTVDDAGRDMFAITSGRVLVWPFVTQKISERLFFGYGKKAMVREGVTLDVVEAYGPAMSFGHPHNAYLEFLLDTGLVGTIPILTFFFLVVIKAIKAFTAKGPIELSISGGFCLAFVLAQLMASFGSQSFYPREGTVLMWCSIAILFRIGGEFDRTRSKNANVKKSAVAGQDYRSRTPY